MRKSRRQEKKLIGIWFPSGFTSGSLGLAFCGVKRPLRAGAKAIWNSAAEIGFNARPLPDLLPLVSPAHCAGGREKERHLRISGIADDLPAIPVV